MDYDQIAKKYGGQAVNRKPGMPPKEQNALSADLIKMREEKKLDRQEEAGKQSKMLYSSITDTDNLINSIEALKNYPGLNNAVGPIDARLPTILGETSDFEAEAERLNDALQLRGMNALRQSSPTGSAGGNMTVAEWPKMASKYGTLAFKQTEEGFLNQLDNIKSRLMQEREDYIKSYEKQYGKFEKKPIVPDVKFEPLPKNPSAKTLRRGVVYDTPKGKLRWNGMQFEDI